ncbi:MAG: hypothetical protein CR959_00325 [Fusobacteriales bacterium]|nr:MAG: hypothetical protein CR959_00325 [Fusobacteriales bacterium]
MVKVYIGKQDSEKNKCIETELIDAGATDFSVEENITALESEVFNDVTAKGDSVVGKIEVGGNIPLEMSVKVLEELMPAISYEKATDTYKMTTTKPAFYTVVLVDPDNNEKWTYVDCVISNLSLNIALGGYVKGGIDIIGKTYDIAGGKVTGAKDRGASLRCYYSNINLDGSDVSEDIEGVDLVIDNGIEAKGSLNSLYNTKIRRVKQVETKLTIQKNEYDNVSFKAMKTKMIAGTPTQAIIKLGDSTAQDLVIITAPKMFINSNKRGDYKGAGSHDMELQASVNNTENSHLMIKFKGDDE